MSNYLSQLLKQEIAYYVEKSPEFIGLGFDFCKVIQSLVKQFHKRVQEEAQRQKQSETKLGFYSTLLEKIQVIDRSQKSILDNLDNLIKKSNGSQFYEWYSNPENETFEVYNRIKFIFVQIVEFIDDQDAVFMNFSYF